jgi:hypothetical protein
MLNILALYRGKTLAVTTDLTIIRDFARRLLSQEETEHDPPLRAVSEGTREALRLIAGGKDGAERFGEE